MTTFCKDAGNTEQLHTAQRTNNKERPGDSTGCVINISAVAGLSPGSVTLIESYVVFLELLQIKIISGIDNYNKSFDFLLFGLRANHAHAQVSITSL